MCVMKNPFEFGRELGVDELVDRDVEMAEVIRTIRNGNKLFLVGPRRYGKTSILKAAEDRLRASGAVVLRYDAEGYPSLDLLVGSLIADAAKQLKGSVERAGEQIRQFFAHLRPELNFNLSESTWSAKVGLSAGNEREGNVALLVEALNGVEELAKAQPKTRAVGLVIDEFQRIVETGGVAAEAQIRSAIQRHKRTGYVFAGSKTKLLSSMTMDASRPFYRLGSVRFVGAIPRADFEAFLRKQFIESGFKIAEPNSVALIVDLAEEVPYNVQMLAHACWEHLRDNGKNGAVELAEAVVRHALERLVRQYDPFYTQLWTAATSIQQKTLLAVIAEGGVNLQSMKVVRVLGKGPSTVQRSLHALMDRGVLREDEKDGQVRMRFEDPFFGHWIRMFTAQRMLR